MINFALGRAMHMKWNERVRYESPKSPDQQANTLCLRWPAIVGAFYWTGSFPNSNVKRAPQRRYRPLTPVDVAGTAYMCSSVSRLESSDRPHLGQRVRPCSQSSFETRRSSTLDGHGESALRVADRALHRVVDPGDVRIVGTRRERPDHLEPADDSSAVWAMVLLGIPGARCDVGRLDVRTVARRSVDLMTSSSSDQYDREQPKACDPDLAFMPIRAACERQPSPTRTIQPALSDALPNALAALVAQTR
jgi:hypothetical protein